ncbi:MAG: kelch repeat-containing protein [Myxococcota bacterium]
MPPILTGLPVNVLQGNARTLANELDNNRLVNRDDGAVRGDGVVSRSEVAAALMHADQFSPAERADLGQMAAMLGVTVGQPAPVKKEWQSRERLPQDTDAHSLIPVGGQLYATSGEQGYIKFSRYDPASDTWMKMPAPMDGYWGRLDGPPTLAECNGKLIFTGGGENRHAWNLTFSYDPATKTWTRLADHEARAGAGAASLDGKMYLIGGTKGGQGFENYAYHAGQQSVGTAQVLDPATNQWTKLPDLPEPRAYPGVVGVAGKIYVIGGVGRDGKPTNRVDVYDPATNSWGTPLRMQSAVGNPSVWLDGGKICVSGGRNAAHAGQTAVETLDPATGTNGELPPIKGEDASRVVVANVEGRLFALGSRPNDNKSPWLREFAPPPGAAPAPGTGGNTIINVITTNNTTTNINVTNIIQNITNHVSLTQLIDQSTHINVVNNTVSYDIDVLTSIKGRFVGYSDPDTGFFLRTAHKDKPLLGVGQDASGQRYLYGGVVEGKGPLPANQDVTLFHPESGQSYSFRTDTTGQFAQALPAELHGRVYLYALKDGQPTPAAPLDLP